jgi:hypothetical protein
VILVEGWKTVESGVFSHNLKIYKFTIFGRAVFISYVHSNCPAHAQENLMKQ